MGIRVTTRTLTKAVRDAKALNAAVVLSTMANAVTGDKSLAFYAAVSVGGVDYDLANSNGKLKKFATVDDIVKVVATAAPASSGNYTFVLTTGILLAAAVPMDQVKAAAAKVIKLNVAKTAQLAAVTEFDAQLSYMDGWADGSPLQVAKLAETTAQRLAVVADIAAIAAEIVRLTP